jgi:hypothetical protein
VTPQCETLLVLLALLAAAALGMGIRRMLPEHHLDDRSRVHFTATVSVVGTLAALVLGFAISNANSLRLARMQDVVLLSSQIVRAGSLLSQYGPEAAAARVTLGDYAERKRQDLFPRPRVRPAILWDSVSDVQLDKLQAQIIALHPNDDLQRFQQSQALAASNQIVARQAVIAGQRYATSPRAVIIAITYWMMLLFLTYGLFTPRHITAVIAVFLSATAIAVAISILLQGRLPFDGLAPIPAEPLLEAAAAVHG